MIGRPRVQINAKTLAGVVRLGPTLADVAAIFECSEDTIERHIREYHYCTFAEFRDKSMAGVRQRLKRKALKMAFSGDRTMLIFCLKHFCGWSDQPSPEIVNPERVTIQLAYDPSRPLVNSSDPVS